MTSVAGRRDSNSISLHLHQPCLTKAEIETRIEKINEFFHRTVVHWIVIRQSEPLDLLVDEITRLVPNSGGDWSSVAVLSDIDGTILKNDGSLLHKKLPSVMNFLSRFSNLFWVTSRPKETRKKNDNIQMTKQQLECHGLPVPEGRLLMGYNPSSMQKEGIQQKGDAIDEVYKQCSYVRHVVLLDDQPLQIGDFLRRAFKEIKEAKLDGVLVCFRESVQQIPGRLQSSEKENKMFGCCA